MWSLGRAGLPRLGPETFRVGCPELSPDRKALLFTAQTQSGASRSAFRRPTGDRRNR